ncbi:MAG TPA: glycosidase [Phycisphaerales bacterium]|nr:glycosidase [Phycisphaerales bacterium]HCD33478.1 glycosidase [Phycisphaerales bacterium]|tara:strand:- start:26714 stop:27766 length:1053 start_codon:yes stop_codon:yes gene_type:complete
MADLAKRFSNNPIITPADIKPSQEGLIVECVLNPGAFKYQNKTGLLMRVAENAPSTDTTISVPLLDESAEGGMKILKIDRKDPQLKATDPRVVNYKGDDLLTTVSHLRLAWSEDGKHFTVDDKPFMMGQGKYEAYGIEDCRTSQIGNEYHLTFTAVSGNGVAVGHAITNDWQTVYRKGLILPPHNKDVAIFEEKVNDQYVALHRPSSPGIGGNYIWIATSPDTIHWGNHHCIAQSRPGMWDSERVGGGCAPIRTDKGWLEIYHGADNKGRYCLGALLLDLNEPWKVLARSDQPIMEPTAPEEKAGFYSQCIFTNGHTVDGDTVTVYYGAADTVICGARLSIREILATLDV